MVASTAIFESSGHTSCVHARDAYAMWAHRNCTMLQFGAAVGLVWPTGSTLLARRRAQDSRLRLREICRSENCSLPRRISLSKFKIMYSLSLTPQSSLSSLSAIASASTTTGMVTPGTSASSLFWVSI